MSKDSCLRSPPTRKEAFREHAADLAPLFKQFGVTRVVEAWGDDVPDGKVTDFKGAVKAEEGEIVVFSWFEYPSKAARDAANEKMRSDPRMAEMGAPMPFDGKRMIIGGFTPIVEERAERREGLYRRLRRAGARRARRRPIARWRPRPPPMFKEYGAVRVVEGWGDDVPDGKVTDFSRAVKAEEGENVVYSWIEWPSKAARDEGWAKVMADPRMQPDKRQHAVRRQAHVLGRLRAAHRQ